jgi:hypothetical protein
MRLGHIQRMTDDVLGGVVPLGLCPPGPRAIKGLVLKTSFPRECRDSSRGVLDEELFGVFCWPGLWTLALNQGGRSCPPNIVPIRRHKKRSTACTVFATAVEDELSRLVQALGVLGVRSSNSAARPAKLPLDERVLGKLKKASEDTGLPQTSLLLACLRLSVKRRRRPAVRSG